MVLESSGRLETARPAHTRASHTHTGLVLAGGTTLATVWKWAPPAHLATAALSGASRHPTADSSCPLSGVEVLRPRLCWLWLERPARADGERRLAQPRDWLSRAPLSTVGRARALRASLLPCRLLVCLAPARGPRLARLWLPPSQHGAEACASAVAVACLLVGPPPPPSGRRHLRIAATRGCCPGAATTGPARLERGGVWGEWASSEPIACRALLHRRTAFAALVAAVPLRAARARVSALPASLLPRTAPVIASRTPPRLRVGGGVPRLGDAAPCAAFGVAFAARDRWGGGGRGSRDATVVARQSRARNVAHGHSQADARAATRS